MSAFNDDFYNANWFHPKIMDAMLNHMPNLQEDYDHFIIYFKDLEASINNQIYLATLDVTIPIVDINIMIERINHKEALSVSKYGIYRDCEDYLVQTNWFFSLPSNKQFEIRFDFYNTIVLGIREAFYR